MNILQLAPRIPFPLSDGGKVAVYNITKHLSLRGHKVTLVAYNDRETNDLKELEKICDLRIVNKTTKDSIIGGLANIFSKLPYKISKYITKEFQLALEEIIKTKSFDIVHVEQLHMAYYGVLCKNKFKLPIVLRQQNVESMIVARFVDQIKIPVISWYLQRQFQRIYKYESSMIELFDKCCAITKIDESVLKEMNANTRSCVLHAGVDSKYFNHNNLFPKIINSICFFGSYGWIPNRDGIVWFIKNILPLILHQVPTATLYIIGKDIPKEIYRYENDHIVIRGYVPEIQQEIPKYEVAVVPLRIGGGVRIKILESFAMKIPVVSTKIGCEGIEVTDSENILIGDTSKAFAEQVIKLLIDKKLREHISNNAYSFVEQKYRWEVIAMQLEDIYKNIISSNQN
jgi:polysaccharide biosynthesis protein PslH